MSDRALSKFAFLFALAFGANTQAAEPGSPYLGWGDEGSGDVDAPFVYGLSEDNRWREVSEAISLADQSVVVIGNISENGSLRIGLAKVTSAGTLDPAFGAYGGFWAGNSGSNWVTDAILDADGQILVSEGGTICRFNATYGALIGFESGNASCVDIATMAGFDGFRANGLVALPDGRMWVAGRVFLGVDWVYAALLRLNANGSLDATFNGTGYRLIEPPPGRTSIAFTGLRQASNGKLIAVGNVDDQLEFTVARFDANGNIENWPAKQHDFGTYSVAADFVLIDDPASSEDDIILATRFKNTVVKLDGQTGLPSADFGVDGFRTLTHDGRPLQPNRVRTAADGKLLIATIRYDTPDPETDEEGDGPFSIVRLLPAGTMDETFGTGGVSVLDYDGDSNPASETRAYEMGLAVMDDAVVAARPAVYDQSHSYETVLIAKRRLFGDSIFSDSFDQ